jgi:nucleotide-binding universal stress UspA family protein
MNINEPIICGIDGSPGGRRAARTARELAEKLHARLVLVHVVPPRPPVVLPAVPVGAHPGASAQLRELDEADAETAFASVADEAAGANAEQVTMHGYAADRLSALAHARGARLIVVGTRGRGPARSALLGSVSQELAAGSCRPVVIVPEAELPTPHGKLGPGPVVCGVDGSQASQAALGVATRIADDLRTRLTLVSVCANGTESSEWGSAVELPAPDDVERLTASGEPAEVLTRAASERNAALLIVGSRGRGLMRAALLGSVSAAAIRLASCPVVVVPPGATAAPI